MRFAPALQRRGFVVPWIALVLGLALAGCAGRKAPRTIRYPVTVAVAESRAVPHEIEATGTVEPLQTVAVTSQVGGVLQRVAFQEGADVRAGQLLFQIDPRPFELDRQKALAAMARDRAQSIEASAQAARSKTLVERELISQQDYETKKTDAEAARANLRADSASVAVARLNLDFAAIRSPISGRAGSLRVHAGNVVKASDTGNPLLTINQMRPILVRFTIPQTELPAIVKARGRALTVLAISDTGNAEAVSGTLTFVDNEVDATTGTVMLKAEFANADGALWPGQFVRVRLRLGVQQAALVVPAPAVTASQTGTFVFVLKPDTTVELRPVQVTRNYADMAVIGGGLQVGEMVVTDGQARLAPGARVNIKAPLTASDGRGKKKS